MEILGRDIKITFLDHVEDDDKLLECIVWGEVVKDDPDSYTVMSWRANDPDIEESDNKIFTIAKSTISKIEVVEKYKTIKKRGVHGRKPKAHKSSKSS